MQLHKEDAEYLRFKIRTTCPNSLLSELLADSSAVDAESIWMLPKLADLPSALRVQIGHARWFAHAIHGGNLLYYWNVAHADKQTALTDQAEPALAKWASALGSEWSVFLEWAAARKIFWDSPAFLESRVPNRTQRFVDDWIDDLVKQGEPKEIWLRESALRLVKDREFQTKGSVRARLWNAAVALDVPPASLAAGFATVMSCLSKGLGAPVGSILASDAARIAEARAIRHQLGGAMRQAGVVAAAGLVALRDGRRRLAEDHANARRLAAVVAELPGVELDLAEVESNIAIFRVPAPATAWVAGARAAGVLVAAIDGRRVRFVTHRDVSRADIERAAAALRAAFA